MSSKPYAGLALLTDLDGTLLMPDKTLSPVDGAAIADFRAKGGLFSFATGRGIQATQPYVDLLQPDFPIVMYNGALVYDTKKKEPVAAHYLPKGIAALLTELMEAFPDAGAEVLNLSGVYVQQDGEYERKHLEITKVPMVMKTFDEVNPEACFKSLFAASPETVNKMLAYMEQPRFAHVNYMRSHDWFFEILPAHATKGTALKKIRETLPAGTIVGASGDFDNDIEMLQEAEACACPVTAAETVKLATRQCGGYCSRLSCSEGFFADWMQQFLAKYAQEA